VITPPVQLIVTREAEAARRQGLQVAERLPWASGIERGAAVEPALCNGPYFGSGLRLQSQPAMRYHFTGLLARWQVSNRKLTSDAGEHPTLNIDLAANQEYYQAVRRLLASPQLNRAPKLRKLLTLICEYALRGKSDAINEYLIATEVFGRKEDFSGSTDPIVRVEMRELRRRLREYYEKDGKEDPIVVEIPLGGYIPIFRRRKRPGPRTGWLRVRAWRLAAAGGTAVALLLVGYWWPGARADRNRTGERAPGASQPHPNAFDVFWNKLLGPGESTLVVLSNPPVFKLLGADKSSVLPLAVPLTREARQLWSSSVPGLADPATGYLALAGDQYTGIGEAMALFLIARAGLGRPGRLIVKQGRTLSEDDFKYHHVVLLGGPAANMWTAKLSDELDFLPERGGITNLRPQLGEQERYPGTVIDQRTGRLVNDYALIVVQDQRVTGHWVVVLFGGSSEGTQAAAEGFKIGGHLNGCVLACPRAWDGRRVSRRSCVLTSVTGSRSGSLYWRATRRLSVKAIRLEPTCF